MPKTKEPSPLQLKLHSLRTMNDIQILLQEGSFQGKYADSISSSIHYVNAFKNQLHKEISDSPEDQVELEVLRKAEAKAAKVDVPTKTTKVK